MINERIIFLILSGIVFFGAIIMYILMLIGDRNFYTICDLYKNKFGRLPQSTELFYKSPPLCAGYTMKLDFIFWPLVYNKKSKFSENVNDVEFIRSLPKKLTIIYVIAFYLSIFLAFIFGAAVLMLYIRD
ncbi:hypothetical protein C3432_11345 [Citrobacter amalonaticus]|uniref:Uncharacterized protein n=1 Tax=Citrobacter amalonaticus TaxID=35703 RepID=A0A2S4S0U5_CITAM|nr:hypothetical protein [Citrobacter amalonaticus]POT58476.1 hypothetical protein C3432_11345 [Citrobacter amalonaticus]POT75998.1 hypothetical protein C3436_00475 [Citrobacter amalonaticus]POU67003.1 hypothetical protein C3430_09545 [Citrobacter amalonaticus]POV05233.1 hypothetical protein C3424_07780 [Citrobacter amalonaticus]